MSDTQIISVKWSCPACKVKGEGWETMREHYDECKTQSVSV